MGKLFTSIRRSMNEVMAMNGVIDKDDTYPVWKEKLIDVKDWLWDKFVKEPIRIKEAIGRVVGWIPVVWRNYDWDYHYMFEIMKYKLERMEKCIREHGHADNHKETADAIKVAKLLLDRICKNDYIEDVTKPLDKEYGGWDFDWTDHRLKKVYKRQLTKRQIHYYEKAISRAYQHADYMEKQDIEYFFKYVQKHYKKWWD